VFTVIRTLDMHRMSSGGAIAVAVRRYSGSLVAGEVKTGGDAGGGAMTGVGLRVTADDGEDGADGEEPCEQERIGKGCRYGKWEEV
jgi:hypothetical protein